VLPDFVLSLLSSVDDENKSFQNAENQFIVILSSIVHFSIYANAQYFNNFCYCCAI